MTDEKIMSKVKALLALAERAGSDEEAQLAREKATELMLRYSIDEARLQNHGEKREESITNKRITVEGYGKAKAHLGYRVAKAMGLEYVQWANTRRGWSKLTFEVYGYESDVAAFEVLFASLLMQGQSELTRAIKAKPYMEHGRAFTQSFWLSFANTVGSRLAAQRTKVVQEAEVNMPGTAIAVRDRGLAVRQEFERRNPNLGKGTAASNSSWSGAGAGRAAGQRANLGQTSVGGGHRAIGR